MTYEEYNLELTAYNKAMATKKSLLMTIRMNKVWITGDNPRSDKRREVIKRCELALASIKFPVKPQKQYGFDVITEEDTYFAPTGNINIARDWVERDLDCPYTIQTSRRQITTNHLGLVW